ncbi:hypothetical protein JZ751_024460 [Albula glossodonta]|uniref:C2H2-type domain-containing protein n=1 Tax=Albula glossodonta TaxID=121402 RepID=A0A8T2PHD0_9TELE|nr:hypothetical protein JZ751_024460 [Albula glossodonta]
MDTPVKTEVDEFIISDTTNYGFNDTITLKSESSCHLDIEVLSKHSKYCSDSLAKSDDLGQLVNVKREKSVNRNVPAEPEHPVNCDSRLKLECPENDTSNVVDRSSPKAPMRNVDEKRACVVRIGCPEPAEITVVIENDSKAGEPDPRKTTRRTPSDNSRKIRAGQQDRARKLNPKVFHCEICGKDIKHMPSFQGDVTKHQVVHTAAYPFLCGSCGKQFKRADCLKKHERVHSSERPYHCPTCGHTFKWEASLKEHQRTHSGERPYVCIEKDCGKSFAHRSTFLQHGRTHQSNPQFNCRYCHLGFNHRSNLVKHERTHSRGARRTK